MKQGFTLIELLAVIVILAIIALIAVPIVINIINDAKEESDKKSIKLYADTVEKIIVQKNMEVKYNPDTCNIEKNGNIICFNNDKIIKTFYQNNELEIEMKGSKPEEGKLYLNNGKIIFGEEILLNNKYYTLTDDKDVKNNKEIITAFLKEYDGQNNLLGFDKTDIVSFERNTKLTKEQVLQKENVQLISNEENDGYKSNKEVYGWIENNHFYWWSEANTVYFHPKTINAFRYMLKIQTIDLTGLDTSKVENFANWFYSDLVLTTISGKINTSGLKYETQNNSSFYRMFSECKKLTNIDLSSFYTKNATNMSYMFFKCNSLKQINLSSFDTKNVTNMSSMFYNCNSLKKIDLSNFDTKNVTNMNGMFQMDYTVANYIKLIVLGNEFDTSKVTDMSYMFHGLKNLNIIYVNKNFVINNNTITSNMFFKNNNIIGGYNTNCETTYNESYVNGEYARISNENQAGYFTYYESIDDIRFNITYDLDGGVSNNPDFYYYGDSTIMLDKPIKKGYIFIGWTGDNGNVLQKEVTIDGNSRNNKHYIAHYIKEDGFKIPGPCTFNGSANITGNNCKLIANGKTIIDYTTENYINTEMQLFNSETKDKNFEIEFTIDSINSYDNQATIINSMYETNPWPGFVFRINTSNSAFELRAGYNGNNSWFPSYSSKKVKIKRLNKKLYYSSDDGDLIQIFL